MRVPRALHFSPISLSETAHGYLDIWVMDSHNRQSIPLFVQMAQISLAAAILNAETRRAADILPCVYLERRDF